MKAIFKTECGDFEMALALDEAPLTAGYFRDLLKAQALDGSSFFRIVGPENATMRVENPIEVIQGGLIEEDPQPIPAIAHEPTSVSGLTHKKWAVSTARHEVGETFGSFFICMRDEPALDYGGGRHPDGQGFAVFGEIVSGFDTVEAIFARREAEEYLKNTVKIHSCALIDAA